MANSILSRGLPGMPGSVPNVPPVPVYGQPAYSMQPPPSMQVPQPTPQPRMNNMLGTLNQIRQFASQVRGNPQQMVMQMIQNGTKTNADLQQAMQMARQITGTGMFK